MNKTNPQTVQIPVKGWFVLANAFCTDAYTTMTFQLDQIQYTFSPAILYGTGDTTFHPIAPYLTVYQPTIGTAGNFNIESTQSPAIPFRNFFKFILSLGPESTQTTAEINLLISLIQVYDPTLFLKSFQELQTQIAPSYTMEFSTPMGKQTVTHKPLVRNKPMRKPNTLVSIPVIRTEEQEIGE